MVRKITSNPLFTLFVLYLLAYGFMLINEGVWWDDWCIYNKNAEGITDAFTGNGAFYIAPIHIFLQGLTNNAPLVYHYLTFFLYFITSIFLYFTLPYLKIDGNTQFVLTAIFTVLPINIARIYMICFPYTLGVFFCFAGLYFFTVALYKKHLLSRLLALVCSFLSFILIPSAYVFIPMYITLLLWINSINHKCSFIENFRSFIQKTLRYIDFIILTIFTWCLYLICVKPSGSYAEGNYNSFSWESIIKLPFDLVVSYVENLLKLSWISNLLHSAFVAIMFIIIFIFLLIIFRKKFFLPLQNHTCTLLFRGKTITLSVLLIMGLYFFIAGVIAYIAVEKTPTSMHLPDTRYQSLLGIGYSLTILGLLLTFIREKYFKYAFIFLLSVFITNNAEKCLVFQRLHYKNLAFMEAMSTNDTVLNNRNFIMIDSTPLIDNHACSYSIQGMARKTFGDETRFIISKEEFSKFSIHFDLDKRIYNMRDVQFNGSFDYYLIIEEGSVKLRRTAPFVKLLFFDLFNKKRFHQDIANILQITCLPYQNEF